MEEELPHYIGVNLPARQGVSNQTVVDAAITQGYDLITSRITSTAYRKRVQALYDGDQDISATPFPMGEDLVVFPGSHVSNTIALCAPWAELDSKDARIAALSLKVVEHEIAYADFCGLPYVVIEGPKRRTHLARYAHALSKLLHEFPEIKIMVHTTFTEDFRDGLPPLDLLSTWEVWDGVRVMCGHPQNLGVALDVQRHRVPDFVVSRWICEPIMMLVLGEACAFVPNPKNYPVLPKHTQQLVRELAKLRPFFLIKENLMPNKTINFNGGDDACLIYLRNFLAPIDPRHSQLSQNSRASRHVDAESALEEKIHSYHLRHASGASGMSAASGASAHSMLQFQQHQQSPVSPTDHTFASRTSNPYMQSLNASNWDSYAEFEQLADVLQQPLQPLHLPLSSQNYEIFEVDAVKYNQYFRAVTAAIEDLDAKLEKNNELHIAVLGAGRGALVDRVLDAVVTTRVNAVRSVKIYAVEMHNGPISFLMARKASEPVWRSVEVVKSDIRKWTPPEPVNLVVSELLGSFGDNELSPECLAAVENNSRVLNPHAGVMIPSSYSSYVAPIYSPTLWSKAQLEQGSAQSSALPSTPAASSTSSSSSSVSVALQKPYVVYIRQGDLIDEPQLVWTFVHPSPRHSKTHSHNSSRREARLQFSSPHKSRVYGFAGYFSAVLYKDITLSSIPHNSTPALKSWFPMYFPIEQPLEVLSDTSIVVSIWRETDGSTRVWYEWAVETFLKRARLGATGIHNSEGHAYSIHLA